MKLDNYPLGHQTCPLKLASVGRGKDLILVFELLAYHFDSSLPPVGVYPWSSLAPVLFLPARIQKSRI